MLATENETFQILFQIFEFETINPSLQQKSVWQYQSFQNMNLLFIFRHNEKVTLECELAELRRQRNSEWEKTKHHLKLAKSKTSLLNIQESFDKETINGNNHRDRDNLSDHNSKDIDSPLEDGGRQGSYVWLELDILSL